MKYGLGDVYEHYIDEHGNKYFTTHSVIYGRFIRQVQTKDDSIDCSQGKKFDEKMVELGLVMDEDKLFRIFDNRSHFVAIVYGSENGIANKPVSLM